MSTAHDTEADEASVVFHLALTQIGAATVTDAIRLWHGVPPTQVAETAAAWLTRAVWLVMSRRAMSRDLAMAYYRLVRALRTGTTIADPYHPDPPYVTLDMLRRQFAALASSGEVAPTPAAIPPSGDQPESGGQREPERDTGAAVDEENDRILVEEIAGLDREHERQEREAEAEIRNALDQLGPTNLERKLRDIDTTAPADEVDAARNDAHRQAGARQAAAAARVAMNGGRGTIWTAASRDRRAVGYVRVSLTGTPCGWCAMLISRGAVYRTRRGAGFDTEGDQYHDNCHCFAEPVWSTDQYDSSTKYAMNRDYNALWPEVTKGLFGKAALSAWRRFIRDQQQTYARQVRALDMPRRRTRSDRTNPTSTGRDHRAAA